MTMRCDENHRGGINLTKNQRRCLYRAGKICRRLFDDATEMDQDALANSAEDSTTALEDLLNELSCLGFEFEFDT